MHCARRVSLIVAGLLVTSASTASAECAWVLWSQAQDITPGEHNPPKDWTTGGGFTTPSRCEESIVQQLGRMHSRPKPGVQSTVIEGSTVKVQMKTGAVFQITSLCLPDTIDPRGPKGGGR
jgi:hypothetical protein